MRSGILGSLIFVAVASAAVCADDIVTVRQADMKAIAAATKSIAGMFKVPSTYSSPEFKWVAVLIRDKAGQTLIDHFASEAASPASKAKPNIIEERDRFDRLANDLKSYAAALAVAAEKNTAVMTDSMRMKPGEPMGGGPLGTHVQSEAELSSIPAEHAFHLMLQTCTTCHVRFRME
ncbi:cytochrome c [Rhizobium sp. 57MFTsu3.2]|uniref:cytochrome c n=1 Tax=Rhizobium sp. 57MFTsu3.2 TaxID=1048681 RepID=UPI00146E00B6|nr:cytochrome c [Rhizobium sp. 57MFTsu3.2]NMN69459.1 cytochrome c556 [Rhizobium sp. 57MFTsu3.2]